VDNTYKRNSQSQLVLPSQIIIENSYIKDLFKGLNLAYVLPSHTTLSRWLLDEKIAQAFHNTAIAATTMWKDLDHSAQKCKELILQFCYYDANKKPFDLPYIQGLDTSMLWWRSIRSHPNHLSELAQRLFNKQICLGVEKLEGMITIRSYHIINIQSELTYFDAKLTESKLCEMVNIATIDDNIINKEELSRNNDDAYKKSSNSLFQTNILLEDFVNLQDPIFQDREI
ncbi:3871_t:CDS:2, partial [Cetraspora pellucida]